MIENATQLLERLWHAGVDQISSFPALNHPVLTGDMWEGLSRSLVDRVVFGKLDLRVATGKIRNESSGELSRQIDCMVVHGAGTKIPFTEQHVYDSADVIAVVEVKKRLGLANLRDASALLHDIGSRISQPGPTSARIAEHAWRGATGRPFPTPAEAELLPPKLSNLYHLIVLEAALPIRIVWGHNGYKTEASLREGFVHCIEAGTDLRPYSLPNLVICGANAIIKTNGMPYQGPMLPDGRWVYYASQSCASMRALLEVLWTRIFYKFGISSTALFGEDLQLERVAMLYTLKYLDNQPKPTWEFKSVAAPKDILSGPNTDAWTPHEVTMHEHKLLRALCEDHPVRTDDRETSSTVKNNSAPRSAGSMSCGLFTWMTRRFTCSQKSSPVCSEMANIGQPRIMTGD